MKSEPHLLYAETNRMMPVVHSHFKRCTEDYEFDLGNDKKVPVKKDTSVVICSYGIHTDPLYWEDPLAFKPERFENNEDVQKARAKGIYMPFGDGPRMCIGKCLLYFRTKPPKLNNINTGLLLQESGCLLL